MPSFRSGPPSARRDLATRLRWYRLDADLTSPQLAEIIGISQSKISKIEREDQSVSVHVVAAWLRACGAPECEHEDLLELAEVARTGVSSWRREHRAGLTAKQTQVADLEDHARRVREFQPAVVPGLLQTADYAQAILRLADLSGQRDIEAAAAARRDRQRVLNDPTKTFEFVVTLPALSWHVDTEQRDRLVSVMRSGGVRVGIVPADADAPPSINSFVIYEFINDDPMVVVETFSGEVYYADGRDVAVYMEFFEAFAAAAYFGDEAVRLLGS